MRPVCDYINRWHLEKRDPKLKLSPPKEPIRFYVEYTAPVRYRRWIKAGIDYWNKAFEKVGIVDAIVIEYQDAVSKIHMEKDPEDVRYNFIRWLNNDVGTAIGPSRVHPETGEILDADIILTDGWIRHFNFNYADLMPNLGDGRCQPRNPRLAGQHALTGTPASAWRRLPRKCNCSVRSTLVRPHHRWPDTRWLKPIRRCWVTKNSMA